MSLDESDSCLASTRTKEAATFGQLSRELLQLVANKLSVLQWARTLSQASRALHAILPETFAVRVDCRKRQLVAGVARWLDIHWRAAKVICLDFRGYPAAGGWAASQPAASASSAGCVRVLRVTCSSAYPKPAEERELYRLGTVLPLGLPRWVAGVAPLCHNLVALHLRRVELTELPALPLLVHLILEHCMFHEVLVASLQGLASLETLHMRGRWGASTRVEGGARIRIVWEPLFPKQVDPASRVWDVRACARLRRLSLGGGLPDHLAREGWDLGVPPACTVALDISHDKSYRPWLARLGRHVTDLRLSPRLTVAVAASRTNFIYAPELSQLRHITLFVSREGSGSLCLARLLGGLPWGVESLHLDYPSLKSEQAVVVLPASLRALRIRGVCDNSACRQGCNCRYSEEVWEAQPLTFALHAGLELLCLVLLHVRVGLQCLDAGALAGLRELNVQARRVDMDTHVAAKVAQRGRLKPFDMYDEKNWNPVFGDWPTVQVAHIGQGPVHVEDRCARGSDWACTCEACPECLGPEVFGGVVDASHRRSIPVLRTYC